MPSFSSTEATAPFGILAVATPLLDAGYTVQLIDSTITPNFKKRMLEEVSDAFCLGISLVTGPMIRETVEIARAIKEWNPDFPIILGGWHPSLLPTQTLEAAYIDIVVRGQGEDALLAVVQRLESGSALDLVAGIGFKRDGRLIFTPERPLKRLEDMPPRRITWRISTLTNELWTAMGDVRLQSCVSLQLRLLHQWLEYTAGSGTPCRWSRWWKRRLSSQGAIAWNCCGWRTDNFLVDLDRISKIAEGLVRAGANFKWSVQATTNLTARLTIEELTLLKRSGLHQICQGIETASPTIGEDCMNKDFQVSAISISPRSAAWGQE